MNKLNQEPYDPAFPERSRWYKLLHWTQTLEDERKLHWCADIPCIWDCKKCLKEVLNSNDNDNDE